MFQINFNYNPIYLQEQLVTIMNFNHAIFPEKLFAWWHPVGYSHEIKATEPFGTFLLDEAIVVWRTSGRDVHAMRDVCIHRGTALSLG